jgi:dihydrofolate reductase
LGNKSTTTLSLIAAMDRNRLIGNGNDLPWRLPADLQHFKRITLGKPVLMGRLTYESIGKPLPGRRNIVITRDEGYRAEGCEVVDSIDAALEAVSDAEEAMVIGGATLYKQMLPKAHRLYVTCIDAVFDGDTWFPEWKEAEWRELSRESHEADERNPHPYSFVRLERVKR